MQNHRFIANIRVLKLAGCQMVLGVDWLKDFGHVTFDFKNLTLQFNHQGKTILLKGVTNSASLRVIGVELLNDFSNPEDHGIVVNFLCDRLTKA